MATIVKRRLSGSSDGLAIGVTATQGATLNTVHAGPSGTSVTDEVWIYAVNNYSQTVELVLDWGQSATNAQIVTPLDARGGLQPVVAGLLIQGSANSVNINAFVGLNASGSHVASSAFVTIHGFVNRITQ